ncbi:NitT/TauT family transport system permease protein [Kitasatospora sp. MAP12-15]|uniref:ABC transporter permease n=1 Tax=unclassified Kitasatospora TaxID=2633591 RepID=UPI0024761BD9|nr:ABC transporter permease [Kitasatospora sp. MAP12-44]MDH6108456.1 NitT/TauT family transport system permease protein [Kitasatospora sp. MAP12-44]
MRAPDSDLVEAGLDALETPARRPAGAAASLRRKALPPLLAVLLVVAVWEAVFLARVEPDWVLPGPVQVWQSMRGALQQGDVWPSVGQSVSRGLLGFAASVLIGTPLGLLTGRLRPLRVALGPILAGLQNLPSVAWVPPAVMFFGVTPTALYCVVLLGAVPSIALGLVSGLDQVPPLFLLVGRNLGARRLASVRHVLLPAALVGYVGGLKQGWAFAWRSLMAAEIIAVSPALGHGLGRLLKQAQDAGDMGLAFCAIILILCVGILVNLLVFAPLERRVLRSRGLAGQDS